MDSITEHLSALLAHQDSLVGLGVLAGSAAIEYVFPPFPGDFVVLFGAVLVTGYGWSFGLVLAAVMLGSIAGALAAYELGLAWARRRAADPSPRPRPVLDAIVARFQRHGAVFIVVNRFLPGVRALIFVAAGLAGVRRRTVVLYAGVSALLWNLVLMALGALVGANLDRLQAIVERYTAIVTGALIVIVVAFLVIRWRRRALAAPVIDDTRLP